MMRTQVGTVTLIGSGEFSDSMSRLYRALLARIETGPRAVFLDTPAGFELNADEITGRALEYFAQRFSIPLQVASFKSSSSGSALEIEAAVRQLLFANFIFAGPGSPTYAIRNWRGSAVWETLVARLVAGAQVVLASAAAIAAGCWALPVYEIYKVGEEPHWEDGLDLLGLFGLKLAVVPHWNNTEGGSYDTRYCYMGLPRLAKLEQQLTDGTVMLGIDEYSACVLDGSAQRCQVIGAGNVTVRWAGQEWVYRNGESFGFERLRASDLERGESKTSAQDTRSLEMQRELIDQARETIDSLRSLSAEWREASEEVVAPTDGATALFVEALIDIRSKLRASKHYALADEIRQKLMELGIEIQDTADGTRWQRLEQGAVGNAR